MADGKAIGIDLGTTSSCVGVMQHDRVEIVADDKGNRTTPSYVAFTDTEWLIGDAAKNQVAMNPNNTVFGFELPLELQAALRQQQITVDLLEYMTDWDWENLAKRCGKEVPYGQLVQVRRIIQERSITEPRVPTSNMSRLLDKTRGFVGKLFDGNEGCGTLIYIGKALGLCAFHSVFVKKTRTVLESTLSVDGHGLELKFVHPALDVAVYRIYDGDGVDREGPFVELDNIAAVFAGNEVHLLSFSAFDSQSRDEEEEAPMLIHGHIARVQLNRESSFSVGQYDSFPNSSGGAILSRNGRLLGMHLESLYHKDHAYYKPPSSPFAKGGPIYANKVGQPLIVPVEGQGDEEASTEESKISIDNEEDKENGNNQLLQHALVNIKSKSSLGVFLPVFYIRSELLHAGLLPGRKKNPRVKKRRQS